MIAHNRLCFPICEFPTLLSCSEKPVGHFVESATHKAASLILNLQVHFHTEMKAGPQGTQGVKKLELWLDLGLNQNNHTYKHLPDFTQSFPPLEWRPQCLFQPLSLAPAY